METTGYRVLSGRHIGRFCLVVVGVTAAVLAIAWVASTALPVCGGSAPVPARAAAALVPVAIIIGCACVAAVLHPFRLPVSLVVLTVLGVQLPLGVGAARVPFVVRVQQGFACA